MAKPTSREQLKQWALRKLGYPVIDINVDDDQLEDRLDEAIQYFQEFHFDGVEKVYTPHLVTSTDVSNEYIELDNDIFSVVNVFPIAADNLSVNMFDVRYQWRINDINYFTDVYIQYYDQTKQHLNLVQDILSGQQPIRFNRHTNKLYIDGLWGVDIIAGSYIIIDGYKKIDEDENTDVWDDIFLKRYVVALFKQQWGQNLSKFDGIQMPGGVTFNGQQIYDQATQELDQIRQQMIEENSEPPNFFVA